MTRAIPSRAGSAAALEALLLEGRPDASDLARAAVLHLADVSDALLVLAAAMGRRA